MNSFQTYLDQFSHLRADKKTGYYAPHKSILLLTIMEMVERGEITEPKIYLTKELVKRFRIVWNQFLGDNKIFTCNIAMPFYHMHSEPFWQLVEHSVDDKRTDIGFTGYKDDFSKLEKLKVPKCSHSVKALNEIFRYADIDPILFAFMQSVNECSQLRLLLIQLYIFQFDNYSVIREFPTKMMPQKNVTPLNNSQTNNFIGNDAIEMLIKQGCFDLLQTKLNIKIDGSASLDVKSNEVELNGNYNAYGSSNIGTMNTYEKGKKKKK